MRGNWLWMGFLLLSCSLQAQEDAWLRDWMELNTEVVVDENVIQDLMEWVHHPKDINLITEEELLLLPVLERELVAEIIQHRLISGPYASLFELQVLPGMTPARYQFLKKVLRVYDQTRQGMMKERGTYIGLYQPHNWKKRGYEEKAYSGIPLRQWHRLHVTITPNWKLGFSLENDAGESFQWNKQQKGFDYGTFYAQYKGRKDWQLLLGDYRLKVGQGLMQGLGNNFGSSTWVARVYNKEGARPYRGSDENLFLRGIYASRKMGNWHLTAYLSRLKSDGRENEGNISESGTGMHRTENEWKLRKQFKRQVLGSSISYDAKRGSCGIAHFSLLENGNMAHQFSLNYRTQVANSLVFGESSFGAYGFSLLQAWVYSASNQLDFSALLRIYPKENLNPYAGGFERFSGNKNERGLYLSVEYQSKNKQKWNLFADWAYRPYPSFLVSRAYWSIQYYLETSKRVGGSEVQARLQYRSGEKDETSESSKWKQSQAWSSLGARIHAQWTLSEALSFSCRIQQQFYQSSNHLEKGMLFFQDLQWRPPHSKVYLLLRYTRFVIPSYDTRIYTYESDVLYAFSIPNYSGAGQRAYAVLRFPIYKGLDAWLKLGYTWYQSKTSIGSQWEEVNSNQQMDLKLLLRYVF